MNSIESDVVEAVIDHPVVVDAANSRYKLGLITDPG